MTSRGNIHRECGGGGESARDGGEIRHNCKEMNSFIQEKNGLIVELWGCRVRSVILCDTNTNIDEETDQIARC